MELIQEQLGATVRPHIETVGTEFASLLLQVGEGERIGLYIFPYQVMRWNSKLSFGI